MTATIIAARVVTLRPSRAEICEDCQGVVTCRALLVVWKDAGRVSITHYHDAIDQDLEIRGCAPDHALTRNALRRTA